MNATIFLAHEAEKLKQDLEEQHDQETRRGVPQHLLVLPGQIITKESGYLRGHGTFEKDGALLASVSGVVERVNKLISVKPLKSRYPGEVGDVVVGRITEVLQKVWKVDVNGRQNGLLMLSAINLPGGVQRRRTTSDELQMRSFFVENDVISAEVQQIYSDGLLALHTRSLKYGKLTNGQLITVPSALIKRVKNHFYTFPFGVDVILGNNGNIWITESSKEKELEFPTEQPEKDRNFTISAATREKICRVRNSIEALSIAFIAIYPDTILDTYLESLDRNIHPKDMLKPDMIVEITQRARERGTS